MELRSEEVQEAPEKRMRRQRESTIDMGGEEDALTIKRLGFDFFPREARRFVGNESPSTRSSRSSCRITDGIQSPWIQSLGRAVLEEDPPRADFFPFPCTAAFFARSRADVFSFTIVTGEARTDLRHQGGSGGGGGSCEGRGKSEGALFGGPEPAAYKRSLPSG